MFKAKLFAGLIAPICLFSALCEAENSSAYRNRNHDGAEARCSRDVSVACATKNPIKLRQRSQVVKNVYNDLIFPKSIAVLNDPDSVGNLFEQSVVEGRVSPVGAFGSFEAAIEYFYALAYTGASRTDAVRIQSLIASGDKVAVEVDIHFCNAPFDRCDPNIAVNEYNNTLRQTGFFTFNRQDRIISFDLAILNLGKSVDPKTEAAKTQSILQVCGALTVAHFNPITQQIVPAGSCPNTFDSADDFPANFPVGPNPFQNCVAFMTSIPYGTWNDAESNSFTCRSLHTLLTPTRPEIHCPHTSPTGGGVCVDKAYEDYFKVEY